jgi:multiple sugar transport system ATP-binding protein
LSNLDAKLRVQMRAEIKELHQRLRTTSVYVTHDQIEAMTMADQIVVMRDGIVEQRGAPLHIYDNPANTFVAGFIGSPAMNFLPGVFRSLGEQPSVEFADGTRLAAPLRLDPALLVEGQAVIFGVRPEHLTISAGHDGIATTVAVVEPTGADTEIYSRFGAIELISIFRERHAFRCGDVVRLVPDPSRTHLFDAASGKAVMRIEGAKAG